jgi:ribosome maturation factor RimP
MYYYISASSGRVLPLFILFKEVFMEEKLKSVIDPKLKEFNIWVDSVVVEKEDNETYLRIVLDADYVIDLNTVVKATRIINPIVDKEELDIDNYILDVYAKPKGDKENG